MLDFNLYGYYLYIFWCFFFFCSPHNFRCFDSLHSFKHFAYFNIICCCCSFPATHICIILIPICVSCLLVFFSQLRLFVAGDRVFVSVRVSRVYRWFVRSFGSVGRSVGHWSGFLYIWFGDQAIIHSRALYYAKLFKSKKTTTTRVKGTVCSMVGRANIYTHWLRAHTFT